MRHTDGRQLELFTIVPNVGDVRSKQVRDLMSFGLFSISNRSKKEIHHSQGDAFISVSAKTGASIASQHDNDILIFIISYLVHSLNKGEKVGRKVFFTANEFFRFTGREHIGGTRYEQIWNALMRLQDTMVHTNIDISNGNTLESRWTFLPEIHRIKSNQSGKSLGFEVVLAEQLYKSIAQDNPRVLTLHRDYFSLRSGFAKFLYLYGRKAAGNDYKEWIATEHLLHSRSGSSLSLLDFRKMLKAVVDKGDLLDYEMRHAYIGSERAVAFRKKKTALQKHYRSTLILER